MKTLFVAVILALASEAAFAGYCSTSCNAGTCSTYCD